MESCTLAVGWLCNKKPQGFTENRKCIVGKPCIFKSPIGLTDWGFFGKFEETK
jgi:hypothetical protein